MARSSWFSRLLHPFEDDEEEDDLGGFEPPPPDPPVPKPTPIASSAQNRAAQSASGGGFSKSQNATHRVGVATVNLMIAEFAPPEFNFDIAREIGQHVIDRTTVLLNLEKTDMENRGRLIDFLGGVAFALGGNLKRTSTHTFLITPAGVSLLSGPEELEAGPYYNQ